MLPSLSLGMKGFLTNVDLMGAEYVSETVILCSFAFSQGKLPSPQSGGSPSVCSMQHGQALLVSLSEGWTGQQDVQCTRLCRASGATVHCKHCCSGSLVVSVTTENTCVLVCASPPLPGQQTVRTSQQHGHETLTPRVAPGHSGAGQAELS